MMIKLVTAESDKIRKKKIENQYVALFLEARALDMYTKLF